MIVVPHRAKVVVPQRTSVVVPQRTKELTNRLETIIQTKPNTRTKAIKYHSNLGRIPDRS
jgi:hypothetical protein